LAASPNGEPPKQATNTNLYSRQHKNVSFPQHTPTSITKFLDHKYKFIQLKQNTCKGSHRRVVAATVGSSHAHVEEGIDELVSHCTMVLLGWTLQDIDAGIAILINIDSNIYISIEMHE
jgi:hypothetical protein